MKDLLIILAIGGTLLGIAVAAYETVTMLLTRRRLDRLAANQRRTSEDLAAMRRAAK
mgnify:FL=1